jgi:hypothetical protein
VLLHSIFLSTRLNGAEAFPDADEQLTKKEKRISDPMACFSVFFNNKKKEL